MHSMKKPLALLDEELTALLDLKETLRGKLSPMDQDVAVSALNHVSGIVLRGGGAEALLDLVRDARRQPRPAG